MRHVFTVLRQQRQLRRPVLLMLLAVFAAMPQLLSIALAGADAPLADIEVIPVVSFEHTINFGSDIDISFVIDAPESVSEVRAVYSVSRKRGVSTYQYPQYSTDDFLRTRFSIPTGGQSYVPPGAEFEVWVELTGADGEVSRTARQHILYLDGSKNWQVLSRDSIPLDFYYYGFSEGTAANLAERVEQSWPAVAEAIGLERSAAGRFKAVIYPNNREFSPVFPTFSEAATDGRFFGGLALYDFGLFMLDGPSQGRVMHELTHLLVAERVNNPLSPGLPSWLQEGLAQYFEAESSEYYTRQLRDAARSGNLLTLRNRNTLPARQQEISLFYTEAGSFVGELIELRGTGPMAQMLGLVNDGMRVDRAIETAYGEPLWQLENEWRARLGASELPAPPPTPTPEPAAATATAQVTPTPTLEPAQTVQPTATAAPDIQDSTGAGVEQGAVSDGGDFNWTGPLIGLITAMVIFGVWSFTVNRRRFGGGRRK